MEGQTSYQSSQTECFDQCSKVKPLRDNFFKKTRLFRLKVRTVVISDTYGTEHPPRYYVLWKKLWHFGLFPGDKDDYIDVDMWMIKITIKTNQIHMDVCFFQM